jgi:small-conductance mechanosensitive channel
MNFAIALAAQDTISNVISGLVIMFDSPFKIGDRIEVTGGDTWGDVVKIGIRSNQVQTRDNRLIIVPNSVVVDSTVVIIPCQTILSTSIRHRHRLLDGPHPTHADSIA